MPLMRLAYASEATFQSKPVEKGVEPHVARILMTSRRNNAQRNLTGGLYYGNNRFFQYLEGEESEVLDLFKKIREDDRHTNIVTLIEESLESSTFKNWSMKYVPLSKDVRRLLESHGLVSFEPELFTARQCEEMIDLIRKSSEDQKLVNYSDPKPVGVQARASVLSPGLKAGLIAAGGLLVGALIYAGSML